MSGRGLVRPEQFPSVFNPPAGYVLTSNEMNMPAGYPYQERKLGFEWSNDSRHRRVDEVLRGLPKVSLADSMKLQTDRTSVSARRTVAVLKGLSGDDAATRGALGLLQGWDAVGERGSRKRPRCLRSGSSADPGRRS